MGRPRKVIPKTHMKITLTTGRVTSHFGDLIVNPITVPGSFDEFQAAFMTWLQEYQRGPKRVRKPAAKKVTIAHIKT